MATKADVIEHLSILLVNELSSVDQYTIHGAWQKEWGFAKLAEHSAKEASEERGHIAMLLERILFLGGSPDINKRHPCTPGKDIVDMLKSEHEMERKGISDLLKTIRVCAAAGDPSSQKMAVTMLGEEEEHIGWIDTQLTLIETIGIKNYLQKWI